MSRQLNSEKKGRILALYDEGYSMGRIANVLNISKATVHLWISREQNTGCTERKQGSGRPYAVLPDIARQIVAVASINPTLTAREIKNELNLKVATQTIRNTLKEANLRNFVAVRKPALTPQQVQQRLAFAQAHIIWTAAEWGSVLFTDESCIQSFCHKRQRVYRPRNSRNLPQYFQNVKQSGRVSISVWSCMSQQNIGPLHLIAGRLDAEQYCDILEHIMIPDALDNHFPYGCFLFQQDNSGIHTSNFTKRWIEEQDIRILDWPSNAADLNPIENIWALLKNRLDLTNVKSVADVWTASENSWNSLRNDPTKIEENFINSMPRRMQEVINNGGNYTSY